MTKAKQRKLNTLEIIIIIVAATLTVLLFVPTINPARVTILINKTMSFFTSAVSYSRLTSEAIRAMRNSWVSKGDFVILYISSLVSVLGILTTVVGASFLIGNNKFKNLSNRLTLLGDRKSVV